MTETMNCARRTSSIDTAVVEKHDSRDEYEYQEALISTINALLEEQRPNKDMGTKKVDESTPVEEDSSSTGPNLYPSMASLNTSVVRFTTSSVDCMVDSMCSGPSDGLSPKSLPVYTLRLCQNPSS